MVNDLERVVFVAVIHTDTESVENAREIVLETKPDVVAVELDRTRYKQLSEPAENMQEDIPPITQGDTIGNLMNQIALLEQSLGSITGAAAGTEMLAAIEVGREIGAKIALIDRPIEVTAQSLMHIPLDEIYKLMGTIPGAAKEVENELGVEKLMSMLKEDGAVGDLMISFKEEFPNISRVLIEERDEYIASALKSILDDVEGKVVAVLGAGHIDGVRKLLNKKLNEED